MSPGTCEAEGCELGVFARGWCVAHYRRWQRHGDPQADRPVRSRPALDIEHAAALYAAGATCRGIGSSLGVSADVIRRSLRAHGITLRPTQRSTPPLQASTTTSTNDQNPDQQHDSTDESDSNKIKTTTTKTSSTPRHHDPEDAAVADAERQPPC